MWVKLVQGWDGSHNESEPMETAMRRRWSPRCEMDLGNMDVIGGDTEPGDPQWDRHVPLRYARHDGKETDRAGSCSTMALLRAYLDGEKFMKMKNRYG